MKLDEHRQYCNDFNPCALVMPKRGTIVKFKNHKNEFPNPYAIYTDFETLNIKYKEENNETEEKQRCEMNVADRKATVKIKNHIPYGFAVYLVSRVNGETFHPYVYRATTQEELQNVPLTFVKSLH